MPEAIIGVVPLHFPWPTLDPFLFCAYHDDAYPAGNAALGVDPPALLGRNVGSDFVLKDGWRMYHGDVVPGFPRHPHRGFETVTLARRGYIDHSDSMGATARFGKGDAQWMTAGKGVVHCEMFPLVHAEAGNPTELFQVWLNLPAHNKMVDPYFTMLWSHTIPTQVDKDAAGRRTEVTVIAGRLGDHQPPEPPPDSWAAGPDADVAIWHVSMEPDATWTLPAAAGSETSRVVYAFEGSTLAIGQDDPVDARTGAVVRCDSDLVLTAGSGGIELMVLQGRPIGEPVARYGPFVMNTQDEIVQAFSDYQSTHFGGWPWPSEAPDHGQGARRFAIHADGRREDVE